LTSNVLVVTIKSVTLRYDLPAIPASWCYSRDTSGATLVT